MKMVVDEYDKISITNKFQNIFLKEKRQSLQSTYVGLNKIIKREKNQHRKYK